MDYEQIRAFRNEKNLFGRKLGIYVEELGPGYARATKTVTEEDLNPLQVPHGGVYFALADTACGSAMAAYGTMAVTISCSFSFLKSARAGDKLTAEARVTGEGGALFAVGTFTFRRLETRIEP